MQKLISKLMPLLMLSGFMFMATVVQSDAAQILVAPASLSIVERHSDSFAVTLDEQPGSDVYIMVDIGDSEVAHLTYASDSQLVFTSQNYNIPQIVEVTAGNYTNGVNAYFSVIDDISDDLFDNAINVLAPIQVTTAGFRLYDYDGEYDYNIEMLKGESPEFGVSLAFQPAGDVVLNFDSTNNNVLEISESSLTFTHDNWSNVQMITINSVGSGTGSILVSVDDFASSNEFDNYEDQELYVDVLSDYAVSESDLLISIGTITNQGEVTLVLNTQPTGNVVFDISSDDPSIASVTSSTIIFGPSDWNIPKNIVIEGEGTGETDIIVRVNQGLTFDDSFDSLAEETVHARVTNNRFIVSTSLITIESGQSDTITVVLSAQPTGSVVFDVVSVDAGFVSPLPETLTFNSSNWNVPQSITLTAGSEIGVRVPITISIDKNQTTDDSFDPLPDQIVIAEVLPYSLSTYEITMRRGDSEDLVIVLEEQPEEGETVTFNVSFQQDGPGIVSNGVTLSTNVLTFGHGDYNIPQTIHVNAGNNVIEGDIIVSVDESSPASFTEFSDQAVSVDVTGASNGSGSSTGTPSCTTVALPFTDVATDNTFYGDIRALYCDQVVSGSAGGTMYNPSGVVTRETMAKYVVLAFNLKIPEGSTLIPSPFTDNIDGNFKDYILTLYQLGVVKGYGDGTYRKNEPVSREVMAVYIYNAMKAKGVAGVEEKSNTFADVATTNQFAGKIGYLQSVGVVKGYGDGGYHPGDIVNRDAMAAFMNRARKI